MIKKIKEIHEFQTRSYDLTETTTKEDLSRVINDQGHFMISNLFMAHFNAIPNYISLEYLNGTKVMAWFIKNYGNEITDDYYRCYYKPQNSKHEDVYAYFFLYEDLIVHIASHHKITLLYRETPISKVEKIISEMQKFKLSFKHEPGVSLLVQASDGSIELKTLKITKPKLLLGDNYNDDFMDTHNIIFKRLSKKNDKGIVLLHGKPGTGKTYYIRYLITKLKKKVIFLPPDMATALTNPNFIEVFIDNPNSILVIEDAENIVLERESNSYSAISTLLNISDGLLSDCLNIQIVCSFNTDVSNIDKALLRKGRLIAKYDFQELETEKANKLSKKLGFESTFDSPVALSEIYNQEDKNYNQKQKVKTIGFQNRNAS